MSEYRKERRDKKKRIRVKAELKHPPRPWRLCLPGKGGQLAAPEAPLVYFLRVAGGKWKTRILWALQDGKCHRYGEIKSAVSGITDMMLSQSLKDLCADGLLHRQYQGLKGGIQPDPSGKTLLPALNALCEWERQMELSNHS